VRQLGVGSLLAVTNESHGVDALALGVGFTLLTGAFDLVGAAALLAAGPGGGWVVGLFALYLAAVALAARRADVARRRATDARLGLANDLLAKMVGQRTRVAQQGPEHWHAGEDEALAAYGAAARASDLAEMPLEAAAQGWTLVGFCALAPAVLGQASAPTLFVGIAGLLLSSQALQTFAHALVSIVHLSTAWATVGRLFRAARAEADAEPAAGAVARAGDGAPLVNVVGVTYRYAPERRPVLDECSLRIDEGDRLLVRGPSGGGKSTLAAVVTGLRRPSAGLVMVGGLDQHSLGPEARHRFVASAPQFHENHIFANTLAFNLLMGRRWPPMPGDLEECEKLCRELGLGALIERMPAGLHQLVGETGWQLSHGEKSRIYLARALLQGAKLVVLDESFGALDPETLEVCVATAVRRAPSLMVIAHP
jgi:ATP-binding cassette subfamily B protein